MPILPQKKKERERKGKDRQAFLVISRLTGRERTPTHCKCLIWFAEDVEPYQKEQLPFSLSVVLIYLRTWTAARNIVCTGQSPTRSEDMAEFLLCHKTYTQSASFIPDEHTAVSAFHLGSASPWLSSFLGARPLLPLMRESRVSAQFSIP